MPAHLEDSAVATGLEKISFHSNPKEKQCQRMLKVKVKWSEVTQLCPTFSDPMDCSLPGSSVHGILQARVLEWGAIAFSEECSNYHTIPLISHASKGMLKIFQSQASAICEPWTSRCSCWFSKRQRNQRSNCQHLLDHQESSRKTSISALLTMPKPLTVWITINCGKFWKRWEYQITWSASWET